ncbi:hypothetical protein [Microbacterium sp. A1-JK]|uniref:hypothetical protein n=1 Tax=Microbacterium sp. A1-JK TaxID=3177516 RepID=UPI0038867B35
MTQRIRALAVLSGSVVTVIGATITVIFFFQPWRSCDYEDTSVGCAMLPTDATVMGVAMWSTLVGLIILALALTLRRRQCPR